MPNKVIVNNTPKVTVVQYTSGVGPPGPRGPAGLPGGATNPFTSDIAIGGGRVVYLDSSGYLKYTDPTTASTTKTIGITTNAASAGGTVNVQSVGVLQDPAFSFVVGQAVFAGANGTLTQTPPAASNVLRVGVATTTNSLLVDLGISISTI